MWFSVIDLVVTFLNKTSIASLILMVNSLELNVIIMVAETQSPNWTRGISPYFRFEFYVDVI